MTSTVVEAGVSSLTLGTPHGPVRMGWLRGDEYDLNFK
jgi:hypothetical protein